MCLFRLVSGCKKRGIVHELTTAYTPEQNPVSERANRTHIETTRAMLIDAKLPNKYWPYAARMSGQIHNWTVQLRTHTSPYFRFYGSHPPLNHLRVFGSTAWVMRTPTQLHALTDRKSVV